MYVTKLWRAPSWLTILGCLACTNGWKRPQNAPWVPTGMNMGVWHTPWGSVRREVRARPCCASTCRARQVRCCQRHVLQYVRGLKLRSYFPMALVQMTVSRNQATLSMIEIHPSDERAATLLTLWEVSILTSNLRAGDSECGSLLFEPGIW